MLEKLLAAFGDDPTFELYRADITKKLEKARKSAIDKRTDARKLADFETWAAREIKRIEYDTQKATDLLKWVAERQATLDAENDIIAKLRSTISTEKWEEVPEEGPDEIVVDEGSNSPLTAAELQELERRELVLRRWCAAKRKSGEEEELFEETLLQLKAEADQFYEQQQQKRRKTRDPGESQPRHEA